MTSRPGPELQTLIGERAMVALAEVFGGTRLYIPLTIPAEHQIAKTIGQDASAALVERLAPDVVAVPLARELRARHYREAGDSNAQIARRLGITERGVEKLFKRVIKQSEDHPRLFD